MNWIKYLPVILSVGSVVVALITRYNDVKHLKDDFTEHKKIIDKRFESVHEWQHEKSELISDAGKDIVALQTMCQERHKKQ